MAENNVKDQLLTIKAGLPPRSDAGLFGLDVPEELAQLVLLGVPWEATTSYGRGTAQAPAALVPASHQLDLFDHDFGEPFLCGIALKQLDDVGAKNQQASAAAKKVIAAWESGDNPEKTCAKELALVNGESQAVDEHVYAAAKGLLGSGKIVGVVGGDHSSPFGLLRAIQEQFHDREWGILHIDAHHDLRLAYEGFERSHASIMRNVMEQFSPAPTLVSVAIRDFSRDEAEFAHEHPRIITFYDREIQKRMHCGETFDSVIDDILSSLPELVYISFDIDGLDPTYCPATGTPVPGGLSFGQVTHLLARLVDGPRRVIGFDLCEVAPARDGGEWDQNVGARILYKLCGAVTSSTSLTPMDL